MVGEVNKMAIYSFTGPAMVTSEGDIEVAPSEGVTKTGCGLQKFVFVHGGQGLRSEEGNHSRTVEGSKRKTMLLQGGLTMGGVFTVVESGQEMTEIPVASRVLDQKGEGEGGGARSCKFCGSSDEGPEAMLFRSEVSPN